MKREIMITSDGSSSIYIPEWKEHYHSKHGAIQEAYHVFIRSGLDLFKNDSRIDILEIGFGTGLNCFITFLEAQRRNLHIGYHGVEAFPLAQDEIKQLNYVEQLKAQKVQDIYHKIHEFEWGKTNALNSNFDLTKRKHIFKEINDVDQFNLIYFDAFGARVQPELWTETIFSKMYNTLKKNGILVTYSAKGSVRRALKNVGFDVEKLPGPPGKREMLRGRKIS